MPHILSLVAAGVIVVDSAGRVWRVKESRRGTMVDIERRRAESVGAKGYLRVVAGLPGRRTVGVMAHRLVWTVLRGPVPDGLQIKHIDLCKANNDPSNLEIVTGAQNIQHSYANGRPAPWHKATVYRGRPRANTPENIAAARAMRAAGASLQTVGEAFGVGVSQAHRMTRGQ